MLVRSRLLLNLASIPTLAGSLLLTALIIPTPATPIDRPSFNQTSCDGAIPDAINDPGRRSSLHLRQGILVASSANTSSEDYLMNFSPAESDAAAVLFGCDCPSCLRALRQLRSQLMPNSRQGHCWTSLQRRVSQPEVEAILRSLEAADVNQPLPSSDSF